MFLPSSLMMVAFDTLWERFRASPWRTRISQGLAPAIVGLVWSSVWTIGRGAPVSVVAYAISVVVVVLMLRSKLSTPLLIILGGGVGVAALR
jgi:chromate transport protein ChrA